MQKIWDRISDIGVSPDLEQSDQRAVRISNRLAVIIGIILILYAPAANVEGKALLPVVFIFTALYGAALYLNGKHRYRAARLYFICTSLVLVSVLSIMPGDVTGERYFFIVASVLSVLLYRRTGPIVVLSLVTFGLFILVWYLQKKIPPVLIASDAMQVFYYFLNLGIVFGLIIITIMNYKRDNDRYAGMLVHKNAVIETKNREIIDSITYAGYIQKAILPSASHIRKYHEGMFVFYRPKDIVSGDFYWVNRTDRCLIFSVADCTGHGVPGALLSMVGHDGLNRCINENHLERPADILDRLTAMVREAFDNAEREVEDGMDMSLCSLDLESNTVEFAGANNPLWIVRSKQEGSSGIREADEGENVPEFTMEMDGCMLAEIRPDKRPVGNFVTSESFTNHRFSLSKGDTVYLFSDGFADQFGGPKGKKFKYRPLKEFLLSIHNLPMEEQERIIDSTFMAWRGNLEQVDDVTLMGIRI